jgi:hypothetical protein
MADDIQGGKPTQKIAQAVNNLKGFIDTAPDQIKQDAEHEIKVLGAKNINFASNYHKQK